MWAEGAAVSAASQRNGRHASCGIKHESEGSGAGRSAGGNAADYAAAGHAAADVSAAGYNTAGYNAAGISAADDGFCAGG
jgi:hypothetical protein